MPKTGMQPIRMAGLVDATIAEIGDVGSLDITVGQIARRAGVSSALAHHYFGTKDHLFLAAMRRILTLYGAEARRRLAAACTPAERIEAILSASFDDTNFRPEIVSAWLNFYVRAQSQPDIARLLAIYRRRLRSNLLHALKSAGIGAPEVRAEMIAALIDGLYLRRSLGRESEAGPTPVAVLGDVLNLVAGADK